jgi:lipocalin
MRKALLLLFLAGMLNAGVAVAAGAPSFAELKRALLRQHPSPECLDVVSVEKVNAESPRINGVAYYSMDYKAQIRFIASCYAIYDENKKVLNGKAYVEKPDMHGMEAMFGKPRQFAAGSQVETRGKLLLKPSDKGWILDR